MRRVMRTIFFVLLTSLSLHVIAQPAKFENGKLVLNTPVSFRTGSDELTEEGKESLKGVKDFLLQKEYISSLRVEGHLDNTLSESSSLELSKKRAISACKWLVENGIDCKRLVAVGFGSTKPVAANDSPENKSQNRRMEFIPAALRGKAIAGLPLDGGGVIAGDPCN